MKETVLGIALTAIAAGIFKLICPESSFKKQISFLIASFFLLSCLALINGEGAAVSDNFDGLNEEGTYVDFSEETYKMTVQETANRLAEKIEDILKENQINCREIRVIIDISSNYSISIKQVRLAFTADEADKIETAETLVKKEVGDEIQIVTEIQGN